MGLKVKFDFLHFIFRIQSMIHGFFIHCSSDGFTNVESSNPDFFFFWMNVVIHLQCRGINQVTKPLQDLGNNLMSMLYITVTSCQKNKCSIIWGSPVWVLLSVWHLFFSQLSIFCFGWMYCDWTGRYKFVAVFFFKGH